MAVKFEGEVLNMSVKSKKIKVKEGTATVEDIVKVGRITIEFDGDDTDVAQLADLVHGRYITLTLDETQRSFLNRVDKQTGEIAP